MIPSFSYPGGKARLRSWILDYAPTFGNKYVEPFAGRGNVFFLARTRLNFKSWHLNDLYMKSWFLTLCMSPMFQFPSKNPTREDFEWLKANKTSTLSVLMEPIVTYSGGGYDLGMKAERRARPMMADYKKKCHLAAEMLATVKITGLKWPLVLDGLGSDDFVYVDPPYMGVDVGTYWSEMVNHSALYDCLKTARFRWLLSEYANPTVVRVLGQPLATKPVKSSFGGYLKTECLWRNF